MIKIISPILLLALVLCGCYADNEDNLYPTSTCDTSNVTYQAVVKPIVMSNCAISGCHIGGSAASIDLDTYDGLKSIATSGKLIGVITHASGFSQMPKNAQKLSDCNIALINKWIANGALNN